MKIDIPRYQQIAADVAAKIAGGEYDEGEKIYVRSSLASQYGVSSETARRAVCVLADMNIVEISKGSGVLIISKKKAVDFINRFDSISQLSDLKKGILLVLEQHLEQSVRLKEMVSDLMYKTERFRSVHPFLPMEMEITDQAAYIGQSLSDTKFWHNTTATIIAIRRDEEVIISPGPYAVINLGDIFYFVGDENCYQRVRNFLYTKE